MTHVRPGDRIAVTGATGFVGQTLVEHLAAHGYQVVGISEDKEPPSRIGGILDSYHPADLTREWPELGSLGGLVHLAGLSAVGPSFNHPQQYITTNSAMVTHMFEHALRVNWQGRAITVSSGAVYSGTGDQTGLTEDSPVRATSPYVVSKLLVEYQTQYYNQRGVDALVARPFNHIGPGQSFGFIVPDLVESVTRGQQDAAIPVGNLDSARDYTDVRDIVGAYRLLLELPRPRHATYNVCHGTTRSGRAILNAVCRAVGKPVPPTAPVQRRAIDPPVIKGSAQRLKAETDWAPTIELQTSIDDFVARS